MPKKKPFIDKKHAITFRLVHRSQRDPLQADDDAPSRVLVSVEDEKKGKDEQRKNEQRKFGVFYEDDYDYMQHLYDLKEIKTGDDLIIDNITIRDVPPELTSVRLPASVLPSAVETTVGLLNKAVPIRGPQPDWDPDIVAALDDDFDMDNPDNVLEDEFMTLANAQFSDNDEGSQHDSVDSPRYNSDDEEDLFEEEETRSRFTSYSMTSSVMRRNQGLTLLDDRFEKLYEEYDDCEIGALDHEDVDGMVTPDDPLLQQVIRDFEALEQAHEDEKLVEGDGDVRVDVAADSDSSDHLENIVVAKPDKEWDCESILSTYSNLYNHPQVIQGPKKEKITLTARLGIPSNTLPEIGLTRKQIEAELRASRRADRACTYRHKGEDSDERKIRKSAVKAERKERRIEKKSNKLAFKLEEQKQKKEKINVVQCTPGVKIT